MPFPLALVGAGVGAATQIAGQVGQNQANADLAQQQQNWSTQMMHAQNNYNLGMWHRTNQYNSPIEQMARLKQAGLNPNLIYGKMDNTAASMIGSADPKPYTRAQSENVLRGVDIFGHYQQLKSMEIQNDNVQASTDLKEQERMLKAVQTARQAFDYKQADRLADISAQKAYYDMTSASNRSDLLGQQYNQAAREFPQQMKLLEKRIEQAVKQLEGQELLNELRRIEVDFQKYGVKNPGNIILSILGGLVGTGMRQGRF